jgi:hypothetical protein
MPVVARAPTAAFDGKYVGVSLEPLRPARERAGAKCYLSQAPFDTGPGGAPNALSIKDGVISGEWEGAVSPQGHFVARDTTGRRMDGQIQSDGTMRGQIANYTCSYNFTWRKQSP